MIENGFSIAAVLVLALACYGFGAWLSNRLGLSFADAPSSRLWRVSLGAVPAGTALACAGLTGSLHFPFIALLTLAGLALAAIHWRSATPAASEHGASESRAQTDASPRLTAIVLGLGAVAVAATALVALAPPTAGDALCYHLELPRAFLREGGLAYLPDAHESTFPLLTEMWFLWALALDGPVAAQLVHFALGLLLLLAVREAAAPLGRNWAWLAAGVAALTPVVTNQMTAPLNDVALAAFAALAWAAGERADRESDRRVAWWIVAGIMLGAACAIKFTGLVFAVAWTGGRLVKLWLAASSHAGRHRVIGRECKAASPADRSSNVAPSRNGALVDLTGERRSGWRAVVTHPVGVVAVAAFLVAGLWYGRAAWHTGNPVHPYFSTVFGNPSETSMRASKRPLGRDPLRWLAAPFETTFSPERFGGRAHQFGPLFLAMLPGLLFLAMDRRAWPALTVVAIYSLFWLLLRQNLRFALPMLPVLSIGVVTVWRALPRTGTARGVVLTVALGMLAFTTLVAVRRARHAWPVAVGVESRADYLRRCEPTTGAAEMVSRLTRSHARLLSQETRAFYFDREIVRESLFRSRTAAYDATSSPDEVAARLTRDAFTHLLLAERVTRGSAPYDDVLSRIALPAIERSGVSSDGPFRLLGETTGRDLDGAEYRYRLVEIEPSAAARR